MPAYRIDTLGEVMRKDFEALYDFMQKEHLAMESIPFSIYHRFYIPERIAAYVACIPVEQKLVLPHGWVSGEIEEQDALKTLHKGAYMHLGNGWMTAMTYARIQKLGTAPSPVGYEFYPNNPYDTPAEALLTEIYLPLKER